MKTKAIFALAGVFLLGGLFLNSNREGQPLVPRGCKIQTLDELEQDGILGVKVLTDVDGQPVYQYSARIPGNQLRMAYYELGVYNGTIEGKVLRDTVAEEIIRPQRALLCLEGIDHQESYSAQEDFVKNLSVAHTKTEIPFLIVSQPAPPHDDW